jgi:DNA-binding NarL/FixJ family response regulator
MRVGRAGGGAMSIRVLIADDERVVRDGLSMLVDRIDDIEVIGAASDGTEAVERARSEAPDVVLMDLSMPGLDGAKATQQIREACSDTEVLVLTSYVDDESVFPALRAGARGYLTKGASPAEIETAIRAVVSGSTHLDPAVQQRLVAASIDARGGSAAASAGPRPDGLSPREQEVLRLIAGGLSNAEIAESLMISEATVKTHVNRVFLKTRSRDRAQAVTYAYEHGIR